MKHPPPRFFLTSADVFIFGVAIGLAVLLRAPALPHPQEYTVIEKILVALTWNWFTIIGSLLGFASLMTAAWRAIQRALNGIPNS